jgi:hypothetical protein
MTRMRSKMSRFGIACAILWVAVACGHSSKGTEMSHSDAEGLWQQSREVPASGSDGKTLSDVYTFRYQAGLVTLRLLTVGKTSWRSPDSFYTLKSRWQGDTLEYLTPVGDWVALATFEHGQFVATGDAKRREYARIAPDQIADFSAGILKPDRPAFDYTQSMK